LWTRRQRKRDKGKKTSGAGLRSWTVEKQISSRLINKSDIYCLESYFTQALYIVARQINTPETFMHPLRRLSTFKVLTSTKTDLFTFN